MMTMMVVLVGLVYSRTGRCLGSRRLKTDTAIDSLVVCRGTKEISIKGCHVIMTGWMRGQRGRPVRFLNLPGRGEREGEQMGGGGGDPGQGQVPVLDSEGVWNDRHDATLAR